MPRHPTLTAAQYDAQWVERVMKRMTVTASGCWLWTGPQSYNGYGTYSYHGRHTIVHRKMFEIANGKLLDRWIYACHKCDERACGNPDHVFEGTPRENQVDMSRKKRAAGQLQTHCKHGHEFTPENTYWGNRGFTKARHCRACQRARQRVAKGGWSWEEAASTPLIPFDAKTSRRQFGKRVAKSDGLSLG